MGVEIVGDTSIIDRYPSPESVAASGTNLRVDFKLILRRSEDIHEARAVLSRNDHSVGSNGLVSFVRLVRNDSRIRCDRIMGITVI